MSTLLALRQRVSQAPVSGSGSTAKVSTYGPSGRHKYQNGTSTHLHSPMSEPGDEAPSLYARAETHNGASKHSALASEGTFGGPAIPSPPEMPAPKLYLAALTDDRQENANGHSGTSPKAANSSSARAASSAKKYGPNRSFITENGVENGTSFLPAKAAERRAMYRTKEIEGNGDHPSREGGHVHSDLEIRSEQKHQQNEGHRDPKKSSPSLMEPSDSEGSVMEQNLELLAQSLRGDQEEAEGVRKGLMMLQPFDEDSALGSQLRESRSGSSSSSTSDDSAQESAKPNSVEPQTLHQSHKKLSEIGPCPSDFLHQIAEIENGVLREDLSPNTWVSGVGINVVCIQNWTARSNNEISIEESDIVDVSFFDAGDNTDWWFGIRVGKAKSRIWNMPGDLPLLRKESGYFPSQCVKLLHPRKKSLTREILQHHQQQFSHHRSAHSHPSAHQLHDAPRHPREPSLSHLNDYFEGQKSRLSEEELRPVLEVPMWRPPGSPPELLAAGHQQHRRMPDEVTESTLPVVTSASGTDSMPSSSIGDPLYERLEPQGVVGTPSLLDLLSAANAAVASRSMMSPGGAVDPAVLWALGSLGGLSLAGSDGGTSVQCRVILHQVRQGNLGPVQRALSDSLIAVNEPLDARTRDTALHAAAANGKEKMVDMLLGLGADASATNAYGQTALDKANIFGFRAIATTLQHRMPRPPPPPLAPSDHPDAPPPATAAAPPANPPPPQRVTCYQYFRHGPAALPPDATPDPDPAPDPAPPAPPAPWWRRWSRAPPSPRAAPRSGCLSCFARPPAPPDPALPLALPASYVKPASVAGSVGSGAVGAGARSGLVAASAVEVELPRAQPLPAVPEHAQAAPARGGGGGQVFKPSPLPARGAAQTPRSAGGTGLREEGGGWREEGEEGDFGGRQHGAEGVAGSVGGGSEWQGATDAEAEAVEQQLRSLSRLASASPPSASSASASSRSHPAGSVSRVPGLGGLSAAGGDLPAGWEEGWDDTHQMPFYINHNNRTTSWHHPNPNSPPPGSTSFLSPRNFTPLHASGPVRAGVVGPASVTDLRG